MANVKRYEEEQPNVQRRAAGSALQQGGAYTNISGAGTDSVVKQYGQQPQQAGQQPGAMNPYTGLKGLSQGTQQQLSTYQGGYKESDATQQARARVDENDLARPGQYTPGGAVTAAQEQMQSILNQKPGDYNGRYGAQLDSILEQITNPGKFHYDFNGDELFKAYADQYTQRGKQASMDAMGQASALTGGYGNSYAQAVGNQAYQQQLTNLYDRGMDLYDRAYQRWQDEQNGQRTAYQLLSDRDNTEYGRYRDTLGDWERNRDYWTGRYDTEAERDYGRYQDAYNQWADQRNYLANRYDTERNFDYGTYSDMLNYWTGLAGQENQDYWQGQNYTEGQRQFDAQQAQQQLQYDMDRAYDYVKAILASGKMPTDDLLALAGLSREDAEAMRAVIEQGGGGGGTPKKTTPTLNTPEDKPQTTNTTIPNPLKNPSWLPEDYTESAQPFDFQTYVMNKADQNMGKTTQPTQTQQTQQKGTGAEPLNFPTNFMNVMNNQEAYQEWLKKNGKK